MYYADKGLHVVHLCYGMYLFSEACYSNIVFYEKNVTRVIRKSRSAGLFLRTKGWKSLSSTDKRMALYMLCNYNVVRTKAYEHIEDEQWGRRLGVDVASQYPAKCGLSGSGWTFWPPAIVYLVNESLHTK